MSIQTFQAPGGSGGGSFTLDGSSGILLDHFLNGAPAASGLFGWSPASSGAGAGSSAPAATPDASAIGVISPITGTTTTGRAGYQNLNTGIRFGGGVLDFGCRFQLPNLPDGTESYAIYLGFGDNMSGAPQDGAYLYLDQSTANFRYRTRSNSVETDVDSGLAPSANTWYVARIVVNAAATSITFTLGTPGWANLANSQAIATNIPTGAGRETGMILNIIKSAGTTSRSLYLDYARFAWSGFSA